MAQPVNVGLVGYEFMGKAHSNAYRRLPMFFETEHVPVLKVICGRQEQKVAQAARRYGWEGYETSWERLVARDDIDLIDISTPNATHSAIALAAAAAGKHVLCEKPLALNVAEAERMLEAMETAGTRHMVCFNYRFVPALSLAKRLVEEGRVGRVYHFRAVYLQDWIASPEFPLVWRLQKGVAGSGAHGDLNAHIIDLARYLVGEVEEVVGLTETFIKERPFPGGTNPEQPAGARGRVTVDDAALFLARFENGAVGSFEASRFAPGRRNYQRIEVNGSEGSFWFCLEDMNRLWFYSQRDQGDRLGFRNILVTDQGHPYAEAWWPPGHIIGYEHTFVHAIYEFMRALDEGRNPVPDFRDGLACQRVLAGVEQSVKDRAWTTI